MSEKRRPEVKIVATVKGKTWRVELFPAKLFPKLFPHHSKKGTARYRVRINGRWAQGDTSFTLTQVMSQFRSFLTKVK